MTITFLAVAFITLVACSGLIAIRFALDRSMTAMVGALILAVEAVALAIIFVRISSRSVFGASVQEPWLHLSIRVIASDHLPAIIGFLAGISIVISGYWAARRISNGKLSVKGVVLFPVVVLVAASVFVFGIQAAQGQPDIQSPGAWRAFDPLTRARSSLPPGFAIEVVMPDRKLSFPTAMTMGDAGEVYVATSDGILIIDDNGSGRLDRLRVFAADVTFALGLAYNDGGLYVASQGTVTRLEDTNGDGTADESNELVTGLPHGRYTSHSNNGMTFGPDGRLYMTVGSTSDHGPEKSPMAGSILVMNRDGTGLSLYASGFRNPFDLAFCRDGRLFTTDNGPDQLNFLEDTATDRLVYRPPDELNLVYEGKAYGYPEFFGYPPPWSETEPPVAFFPMSAVATGVACYDGDSFPETYRGNLFVTQWGSLVTPEQTGHKLVRVELTEIGDFVVGTVHIFANLWRPIGVLVHLDGSLLVLDNDAFRLYRISYVGNDD